MTGGASDFGAKAVPVVKRVQEKCQGPATTFHEAA
jgi:hypothetical protein